MPVELKFLPSRFIARIRLPLDLEEYSFTFDH
jgi:hypothetical protein